MKEENSLSILEIVISSTVTELEVCICLPVFSLQTGKTIVLKLFTFLLTYKDIWILKKLTRCHMY